MASNNTPLSAIVASLLSAFDSSRQLFHRIKNSAQKKQAKSKLSRRNAGQGLADNDDAVAREEQLLQLQLQRAPKQITEAFEGNAGRFGERYRRGDERAKTSLNHTLLVLNTGLTKIISSLLGRNDNTVSIRNEARKSLLSLSEKSARDALMELEGLRGRLESMSSLQLRDASLAARQQHQQRRRRNHKRLEEGKEAAKTTAAHQTEKGRKNDKKKSVGAAPPGPVSNKRVVGKTASPQQQSTSTGNTRKDKRQLQENHPVWVRSKNSSTIALDTRPTYKRASSSGDNTVTKVPSKPNHSAAASSPNLVLSAKTARPPNPPGRPSSRPHHTDTIQQPLIATQRIGNNYPPQITQQQQQQQQIDAFNINKRLSILSGSSGSTKLGEIPQHKWINPWIPPVEVDDDYDDDYEEYIGGQMQNGDNQGDGGSKRGGLRFWRRLGRTKDHV